jgi:hypothetical protein
MTNCKSLGVYVADAVADGWGTCAACGRFMPVRDGKMIEHHLPIRWIKIRASK